MAKENDMKLIWAPWRIEYILMKKPPECIFCVKPGQDDDEANYILYRGGQNFIIMNKYPYNPGHLMVAPYRHVDNLEMLSAKELHEHYDLVSHSLQVLKQVFNPEGFNLGMNLGKVAGAGIEDHIHTHVVPRWNGDNNYMPVIADVRVVPEALNETYQKLKGKF